MIIERYHKLSFETNDNGMWPFWSALAITKWSKMGLNSPDNCQNRNFEASRGFGTSIMIPILIDTIMGHQYITFETIYIEVWSF